jgi:hypothetical protein
MEFWSDSFTGRSVVNEFSLRTHWIGENRYGGFGEKTNILLMQGIELRFVGYRTHGLVTVQNVVSQQG